jgi:hypothetical protein
MPVFVREIVLSRLEAVAKRIHGWAVTAVLYLLIAMLAIIGLVFLHAARTGPFPNGWARFTPC